MRLLSLEVENYRNIASASLTPGRELTVICGNNGQGKTNLLEAIWLLTGGKSFRGGKDAELVRRGEPFAVLKASTLRAQQEEQEKEEPNRVRLTVGAPDSPRPGRTVSVNGGAVKRAASLAGSFPAVVFDPGHLSLVKGAPEGRRALHEAQEGRAGRAAKISGRCPLPALPRLPDPLSPLCSGLAAEKRAASTLFQWH